MSAPESARIRRLLVVRSDRLGDLMKTLPVFEAARKALPGAHIVALAAPYAAPLLGRNPHLDEVIRGDPAERDHAYTERTSVMKVLGADLDLIGATRHRKEGGNP